jgi:gamma-glutamyltranspeptidase
MVEEFQMNGLFLLIIERSIHASLGGIITLEDFANYRAIVRPDSEVVYTKLSNGRTICGPPPPSGSAVTQAILSILDGYCFSFNIPYF